MPTRFSLVLEDERAGAIETLARRYDITEEEAIRQLVEVGLENVDDSGLRHRRR